MKFERGRDFELIREDPGERPRADDAWHALALQALLREARGRSAVVVLMGDRASAVPEERERARRLVASAAPVLHPALPRVLGSGELDAVPFLLVEDLREHRSLAQVLDERGPAHWEEAVALARSITSALAALQAAGVFPEEAGPASVLIDSTWRARLAWDVRRAALADEPAAARAREHALRGVGAVLDVALGDAAVPPRIEAIVDRLLHGAVPGVVELHELLAMAPDVL